MRNLKPYGHNTLEFYRSAVAQKDPGTLKDKLNALESAITDSYDRYNEHFGANTLESLDGDPLYHPSKAELLSLYSYRSSMVRKLRLDIEQMQDRHIANICQLCSLTGNESLDHFLPKEEFPEFAINPINLLPCCLKCNQHKSKIWRKDGQRTALNLYTDKLPEEQYLFVKIFNDQYSDIDLYFYLDDSFITDQPTFELLYSHYTQLDLFSRMREKAIPVLSEMINAVTVRSRNLPFSTIQQEVIAIADLNRKIFGANHWRSIFEIALINSPEFQTLVGLT